MLPTSASRWAASVIMARLCAKYPPAREKMYCLVPQGVRIGMEKRVGGHTPKRELSFFSDDRITDSFYFTIHIF